MNERIRRLMEQAVISIDGQTFGKTYIPDAFTEKFAELIVKECVTNVKDWEKDSRNHISYMLERHFGVEE